MPRVVELIHPSQFPTFRYRPDLRIAASAVYVCFCQKQTLQRWRVNVS